MPQKSHNRRPSHQRALAPNTSPAEDARYRTALKGQYRDDFAREILSGETYTLDMMGLGPSDVQMLESSAGTIVRYIRKAIPGLGRDLVVLFAMISPARKITKIEVDALRGWIATLEESIANGDIVYTSVNSKTRKILINALNRLRSYGYPTVLQAMPMPAVSYDGDTWETVVAYTGEPMDPMQVLMSAAGSPMRPNSPHARMTYVLKSFGDKVARDTFSVVSDRYASKRDRKAYVLNERTHKWEWTDLNAENLQNEIDKSFPDGPPLSAEALIPWVGQRLAAQQKEVRKGRLDEREYDRLVDSLKRMLYQIQVWAEHTQPDLTKLSIADAISQAAAFEDPGASVWVRQGEVIYRFADGWTIQNLTEPLQIFSEGDSVGHCLKERELGTTYLEAVRSGKKKIFSLRKPSGLPVVSISYIPGEQRFDEILAKQNTPLGISLDSMLEEPKWKHRPEQARALWSKIQEYKPRIAEFLTAFGADALAFVMADAPLPAELTTLGHDHPVPTALIGFGGGIRMSDYSHPLPARLISVGCGLYLAGYEHPLPAGLTSVGKSLVLHNYRHPLPAGLTSVGGGLSLHGYNHPLPAGLTSVGGDLYLTGYGHPLPAGLTKVGGKIKGAESYPHSLAQLGIASAGDTLRKNPRKTSRRPARRTSR